MQKKTTDWLKTESTIKRVKRQTTLKEAEQMKTDKDLKMQNDTDTKNLQRPGAELDSDSLNGQHVIVI